MELDGNLGSKSHIYGTSFFGLVISHRIHVRYIYFIDIWLKFIVFIIGKYTVRPMDPSWDFMTSEILSQMLNVWYIYLDLP